MTDHATPEPVELTDAERVGVRCGTAINADDPTDVIVLVQIGAIRATLTPDGARQLAEALAIEAAYATVCAIAAREGKPLPTYRGPAPNDLQ